MKSPLISVIVPVYNMEKYLSYCVDSLLRQTYENLEILLIDDGSTDSSLKICQKYAAQDARCKLFHQENRGLGAARNLGLKYITGDYVIFIDSDDYVDIRFIETLYQDISSGDYDLSMVGYQSTSDYQLVNMIQENSYRVFTQKELIRGMYNEIPYDFKGWTDIVFIVVWNKLYKKDLLEGLYFVDSKYAEDMDFTTKVYLRTRKAIFNNAKLHYYLQRDSSVSHQGLGHNYEGMINSYIRCLQAIPNDKKELRAPCLTKLYKQILNMRYLLRNQNDKKNFKVLSSAVQKQTLQEMLFNKFISLPMRISILSFYLIPQFYYLFMKYSERKARFDKS